MFLIKRGFRTLLHGYDLYNLRGKQGISVPEILARSGNKAIPSYSFQRLIDYIICVENIILSNVVTLLGKQRCFRVILSV